MPMMMTDNGRARVTLTMNDPSSRTRRGMDGGRPDIVLRLISSQILIGLHSGPGPNGRQQISTWGMGVGSVGDERDSYCCDEV